MFSRNRSAQLLELPLLSRFAPDLRRRAQAFAYKPHHKIHNTSPSRAITTEDIHRSREFRQNRGGDSLADRRFSKQNPSSSHRLAPFSSLASGEHREAFALVPGTYAAIATKKGMSERKTTNAPTKLRRKKEEEAEEEGTSGRFLTIRSEKRGKTGGFCRISGGFRSKIPDFSRSRWERRAPVWPFAGECVILPQLNPQQFSP